MRPNPDAIAVLPAKFSFSSDPEGKAIAAIVAAKDHRLKIKISNSIFDIRYICAMNMALLNFFEPLFGKWNLTFIENTGKELTWENHVVR